MIHQTLSPFVAADEVKDYLATPQETKAWNPSEFWLTKNVPILARMARAYLDVPSTSTPSECVFNAVGRGMSNHQVSMHPNTLESPGSLKIWKNVLDFFVHN